MAKIKGWKKINENEWKQEYSGKGHPQRIFVSRYGNRFIVDGGWWNTTFNTRKEAQNYAIKHMRSHPNG